ncbi:YggS family pyridoxal phosphate-dependent enzyme [Marinicella sediminis]|uniref:YggS family pyridoxal phosphate-dependent enzyme n=1 Tax=Marinicella sediminis TaxID=1792834 RepID=UPI000984DFE7|nr:YggS family pyridoxal phosphate-dependent enzyme [Marinicella sediminis]
MKTDLSGSLQTVIARIEQAVQQAAAATTPRLLAVSKKQPVERLQSLYGLGQRHFGESYVQEALAKMAQFGSAEIVWHFIGPVQSNKTKQLAAHFDWVQSVDRMKILRRLNDQRPADLPPLNVLLQLKVGDEDSKSGAQVADVLSMADAAKGMSRIKLRGLMCIPPPSDQLATQRAYFNQAHQLFDSMRQKYPDMDTLSMGMSGDLEAAIMEGSTMVRIGTDLMGRRD